MVTQYSIRFLPSDRQVITVQAPWKKVPCVLRVIREIPANISEAKIAKDTSTFYLDRPAGELADQLQVFTKLESFYNPALFSEDRCRPRTARRGVRWLSCGTYFIIYNRKNTPYTTLEFVTEDREGLLHDLLQMILAQPVRVDTIAAHLNRMWDDHAYVVLQLHSNGNALVDDDVVHIEEAISRAISITGPMI